MKSEPTTSTSTKRKREPKFTDKECTFIFQQAGKKQALIVGRHGPSTTEEKKNKFWEKLAQEVTSLNGNLYKRTSSQVKKKWTNTRSSAKAIVWTIANKIKRQETEVVGNG